MQWRPFILGLVVGGGAVGGAVAATSAAGRSEPSHILRTSSLGKVTSTTDLATTTTAAPVVSTTSAPDGHELTVEYFIADHADPVGYSCQNNNAGGVAIILGPTGA